MITLSQYYMHRDIEYQNDLTSALRLNATETVRRVNAFLKESGIAVKDSPRTKSPISSGWRPAVVNRAIKNAAPNSKHMTCQACDIYDPDGELDDWAMDNLATLDSIGLWLEHPASTKGWIHLQIIAPKSGRRVFYP